MATNKPTTSKPVPDVYLGGQGGTNEPEFNGYVSPASDPSVPGWKRNLLAAADAMPMFGGGLGQLGATALAAPAAAAPPLWWALPAADVAGGGLGGAAGQALREGAYRMLGYNDAPGTVGGASREQAAASLVGTALAPGVQLVAKQGYKNLFRPTIRMLREDPQLLELAYKLGAVIPKEGSKSALRAAQMESKQAADELLRNAGANRPIEVGTTIPAQGGVAGGRAPQMAVEPGASPVPMLGTGAPRIPERTSAGALVPAPRAGALAVPAASEAAGMGGTAAGQRLGPTFMVNDQPTVMWSELDKAEAKALRAAGKGDTGERRAAIKAYFNDLRENWNPSHDPNMPLTYEQLMVIKRGADETSSPVFRAKLAASNQAKPDGYYKGAETLRNHIMDFFDDGTPNALVPGLRKINSQTQQYARVAALAEESALPRKFNYFAPHHGTNPVASTAGLAAGAAANFLGAPLPVSAGAAHLATMGASAAAEAQKPALSAALLYMAKNPVFRYQVSQLPRAADYLMGYPLNPNPMPTGAPGQSGPFGTATPGEVYLGDPNQ